MDKFEQLQTMIIANATTFGSKVLAALAFWIVGRWLIGFIGRVLQQVLARQKVDPTLMRYIGNMLAVTLNIVLVVAILGYFGIETTSFAALVAGVGIAIGAGTDVAIGSAGVILASSDPRSVLSVIELSRASYRKMKQNLWWAGGYNLLAVPPAAGVLAPIGFVLPISVGAILMSLSTIVVALNAQLLRRLDLNPETSAREVLTR